MKFKKLLEKIGALFNTDTQSINQENENKLKESLDEKIISTKEKIKGSTSKSKVQKLKAKLRVLEDLKEKLRIEK